MEKDFNIFGDKNFSDLSQEIYENNNSEGISFEIICFNIPKSIGSRSSIQSTQSG